MCSQITKVKWNTAYPLVAALDEFASLNIFTNIIAPKVFPQIFRFSHLYEQDEPFQCPLKINEFD